MWSTTQHCIGKDTTMNDLASLIDQTAADAIVQKGSSDADIANDILKECINILKVQKNASSARIRKACRKQWPDTQFLGDRLIDACTTLHEIGVLEEVARELKRAFKTVNPWSAAARLFPQQATKTDLVVRQGLMAWLESFGLFNMETATENVVHSNTIGSVRAADVVAIYLGQRDEPTKAQTAQALREFCTDDWTESVEEVSDRINSDHQETVNETTDEEAVAELIDNLIDHVRQQFDDALGIEELEAAEAAAAKLPQQVADACRKHHKSLRPETADQLRGKAGAVADAVKTAAAM